MKTRFLILFILIGMGASAQTYTNVFNYGYKWLRGNFQTTLIIPKGPTPVFNSVGDSTGAIFYNTTDSAFYIHTGTQWMQLSSGGSTYLAGWGLVLNTSTFRIDTSSGKVATQYYVGNNHYTKNQINSFFSGITSISGYNKANWDAVHSAWSAAQALSPSGWATQSALVDTAAALRAAIGSGGSMVYPGAGIPVSTGSAWGTSLTNTTIGTNFLTATNPSAAGYFRTNADNTITHRTYAQVLSDIGAQASLGFTPEDVANKATDFSVINNTKYPTTQATDNRYIKNTGTSTLLGNVIVATGTRTFNLQSDASNYFRFDEGYVEHFSSDGSTNTEFYIDPPTGLYFKGGYVDNSAYSVISGSASRTELELITPGGTTGLLNKYEGSGSPYSLLAAGQPYSGIWMDTSAVKIGRGNATNDLDLQGVQILFSKLILQPSFGDLEIDSLNNDDAETKLLTWNSTSKDVEYRNVSSLGFATSNIYNSDGILTGNRILTGLNNTSYLAFDSLNYFRVSRDG